MTKRAVLGTPPLLARRPHVLIRTLITAGASAANVAIPGNVALIAITVVNAAAIMDVVPQHWGGAHWKRTGTKCHGKGRRHGCTYRTSSMSSMDPKHGKPPWIIAMATPEWATLHGLGLAVATTEESLGCIAEMTTDEPMEAAQLVGGDPRLGSAGTTRAGTMVGEGSKPSMTPNGKFEGPNLGLGRARTANAGRLRPGWQRRMHTSRGRSRTMQRECRSGRRSTAWSTAPSRRRPSACWRCGGALRRGPRPKRTATVGRRARWLPKRVNLGLHDKFKRQKKSQKSTMMIYIKKGPNWTQLWRRTSKPCVQRGGVTQLATTAAARQRGCSRLGRRRLGVQG